MNEIYDIDTEKIKEAGNNIISLTNEFQTLIETLKKRITQINSESFEWEGKSANNFVRIATNQIDELYPFINMLIEYGKEVNTEANEYEQAVNDIWRFL